MSLLVVLVAHLFVYLRSCVRYVSYLSRSSIVWCSPNLRSEITTTEDARFRKTMQRLCSDGALSNSDTLRNKVMTEVHFWCRGKPHKLTMQQNNEMWELAQELQSGPKVGEIGMLSPELGPTTRSKSKKMMHGVKVLEGPNPPESTVESNAASSAADGISKQPHPKTSNTCSLCNTMGTCIVFTQKLIAPFHLCFFLPTISQRRGFAMFGIQKNCYIDSTTAANLMCSTFCATTRYDTTGQMAPSDAWRFRFQVR